MRGSMMICEVAPRASRGQWRARDWIPCSLLQRGLWEKGQLKLADCRPLCDAWLYQTCILTDFYIFELGLFFFLDFLLGFSSLPD
jgi:hypothetical protein